MKTYKKMPRHNRFKRRGALIACLVVGLIGVWLLNNAFAASPSNPPLTQDCNKGLDIAFLFDGSGSMNRYLEQAQIASKSFITALSDKPMTYTIGTLNQPENARAFDPSISQAFQDIDTIADSGNESYLGNLQPLLDKDPRPNNQNLFVLLTDGIIGYHPSYNTVKARGSRILIIGVGQMDLNIMKHIAGPRVDTGSIWTSDVSRLKYVDSTPTLSTPGFASLDAEYKKIASQLCNKPKTTTTTTKPPGTGAGPGAGKTTGNQTGTAGTNKGKTGDGASGGGSSANKLGKAPNAVPAPAPQGIKEQEPPQQQPSPFFDGKQYAIGSDPDAQAPADLVQHPGKILSNVWFYILGGVVVAGGVGGGYWWWWWIIKRRPKQ